MKKNAIYITDSQWFEAGALKNPITAEDHTLKEHFPEFYSVSYDLRILAAKTPTMQEKSAPFYNEYREKYGQAELSAIDDAVSRCESKNVFLNGFDQAQFEYIAPLLRERTELLYLFKCLKLRDLSPLSEFRNLKCVCIFGNNALESLWDMKNNSALKALSFVNIKKLRNVETLIDSCLEYICFDSMDNSGNKEEMLFDPSVLSQIKSLKHVSLNYKGIH